MTIFEPKREERTVELRKLCTDWLVICTLHQMVFNWDRGRDQKYIQKLGRRTSGPETA